MIGGLLLKELRAHAGPVTGVVALTGLAMLIGVADGLRRELASLMLAPANIILFGAPIVAMVAARRLFVWEHERKTSQWLAALPVSPVTIAGLKWGLGLFSVLAWSTAIMLTMAQIASGREVVAWDWRGALLIQGGAYTFAWFSVAACLAQLGRYRFVGWLILIMVLSGSEHFWMDAESRIYWFGPLIEPVDRTRYAVPWGDIGRAAVWGGLATGLGFGLAIARGGLLVRGWYQPMSGRERASATAVLMTVFLLLTLASSVVEEDGPQLGRPPAVASGIVRVADSPGTPLWRMGRTIEAHLQAIWRTLDLRTPPRLVLVQGQGRPYRPVQVEHQSADGLWMRVDPSMPVLVQLHVIEHALIEPSGGFVQMSETEGWMATGFAGYWLAQTSTVHRQILERRAGWAFDAGLETDDLLQWTKARVRFGRDVSDGIAFAGLMTLERLGGREAALQLVRVVLGAERPKNGWGLAEARWAEGPKIVEQYVGADWATFRTAWVETCQQMAETHRNAIRSWYRPAGTIEIQDRTLAQVRLNWIWEGEPPPGGKVWWSTAPPLSKLAYPSLRPEAIPLDPTPIMGASSIAVDPRDRVMVTFAVPAEPLHGWLVSGWWEIPL